MSKRRYRSRRNFWGDSPVIMLDVDLRHSRLDQFGAGSVVQVSENVWHIIASSDPSKVYIVEKCVDNIEAHREECDTCQVEFDQNEDYCSACEICCDMYECDCPDEHLICKHIHKVHNYAEKAYYEQRPHDLEKSMTQVFDTLKQFKYTVKDDKDKFLEDLQAFVATVKQKYNV